MQKALIVVKIKSIGQLIVEVDENLETSKAIINSLPFESTINRWGDEIYFKTPVSLEEENSRVEVKEGEVAYWPPGKAMCIFFGPTPISSGNKILAYSPVNVFGKVVGDYKVLRKVKEGEKVRVEKLEQNV